MEDWHSRERLEPLIQEGLTIRQIAVRTGYSFTTVRYWLRRHGLQTSRQKTTAARKGGTLPKHAVRTCPKHGTTDFVLEGRGYYRCKRCRAAQVSARRRRMKEILVAEAGGACALCGYDRYQGALEFHHVDPAKKGFGLSLRGITLGIDRLRAEATKCVLLCSNCHAEVEGGFRALSSRQLERSPVM